MTLLFVNAPLMVLSPIGSYLITDAANLTKHLPYPEKQIRREVLVLTAPSKHSFCIYKIVCSWRYSGMILNFWTVRFGQTVLLEEQSDQCLHCLTFHLHHSEVSRHGRVS